jgi:hypothetical protein
MLHLEHLGPELAEDGGGIGAGEEVADIDDPDAGKRERSRGIADWRGTSVGVVGRHRAPQ